MKLRTLGYQNNYDAEFLPSSSGSMATFSFFQERDLTHEAGEISVEIPAAKSDWLSLKLHNYEGDSWIGEFEPGVEGISGLYATPSEFVLCVVNRG